MTHKIEVNIQTGSMKREIDETAVQRQAESELPIHNPLNKFQFEAALFKLGLSLESLDRIIDGLQMSPDEKILTKSRIRNTVKYHRDHPLFEALRKPMGITEEQIDAVWLWAKDQV